MEMNMGKFSEKLVELLELAKKKKNVLEYQEISDFFKDQQTRQRSTTLALLRLPFLRYPPTKPPTSLIVSRSPLGSAAYSAAVSRVRVV